MREPVTVCIALGANLGDARSTVMHAIDRIGQLAGCTVLASSRLYRTAPWQAQGPDFVNAVVKVSTRLTAPALLQALQALEQAAGRERPYLNAPRTLDLDILLYGAGRIDSAALTVPHPRMMQRAFALYPLADVLPDFVQPADRLAVQDQAIEVIQGTSDDTLVDVIASQISCESGGQTR
jgi:2-amino-4-hydroxy-6-hydroxymethyldihydropteridine diphosphokinase